MDAEILRSILLSGDDYEKIKSSEEWQTIKDGAGFPPTSDLIINTLSKSFSNLLTFKVSQEAYQRYSVRLNLIETLREWCLLGGSFQQIPAFQNGDYTLKFFINFLEKYITADSLYDVDNVETLVSIGKTLINLISEYESLLPSLLKVIERMIVLEQKETSIQFLKEFLKRANEFKLELSFIESILQAQSHLLIEETIEESYALYISNANDPKVFDDFKHFFNHMIKSPLLFYKLSSKLKDLFLKTHYNQITKNYIQEILKKVQAACLKDKRDILDLYAIDLQYCVILMRISPALHSEDSKKYILDSIKNIFLQNHENAYILFSHFPEWLREYEVYLKELVRN